MVYNTFTHEESVYDIRYQSFLRIDEDAGRICTQIYPQQKKKGTFASTAYNVFVVYMRIE